MNRSRPVLKEKLTLPVSPAWLRGSGRASKHTHPTLDAIMEVDKWASAKTLELYRQDKNADYPVSFFLILIILILAHELGISLLPKFLKCVWRNSASSAARLFSLKRRDRYSLNAIPLGGSINWPEKKTPMLPAVWRARASRSA